MVVSAEPTSWLEIGPVETELRLIHTRLVKRSTGSGQEPGLNGTHVCCGTEDLISCWLFQAGKGHPIWFSKPDAPECRSWRYSYDRHPR